MSTLFLRAVDKEEDKRSSLHESSIEKALGWVRDWTSKKNSWLIQGAIEPFIGCKLKDNYPIHVYAGIRLLAEMMLDKDSELSEWLGKTADEIITHYFPKIDEGYRKRRFEEEIIEIKKKYNLD